MSRYSLLLSCKRSVTRVRPSASVSISVFTDPSPSGGAP